MINKISKKDLEEFISICESSGLNFDKDWFFQEAIKTIKYYRGSKELRKELRSLQNLEELWYESLSKSNADYSLYDRLEILPDIWSCWVVYSREYIKAISSTKSLTYLDEHGNSQLKSIVEDMGNIKNIADLGCGIGYTSSALKQVFPNSKVYGTNLETSNQYAVCQYMAKQHDWKIVPSIDYIPIVDLVFASEYFEHFENPIEHLQDIISQISPKYFIIANAFAAKSLGHFDVYKHENETYTAKEMNMRFNSYLRLLGYTKVKTNCWNNRPNYWKKNER